MVFPYLFPPPPVNEVVADKESRIVIARGEFIHANPSDPVHYGRGKMTLYEDLLHLEADFEVGPGPKFHLYLVPNKSIRNSSDVKDTMFLDLGQLRSFKGSQKFQIPNGIEISKYPSVVIWCAQFDVLISPADLSFK